MLTQLTDKKAQSFADQIGNVFKGTPHLPQGIVDFLVKIAPWLVVLGGVVNVLSGLSAVLGGDSYGRMAYRMLGVNSTYFMISGVFAIVLGALYLMAFSPLKEKKMEGWMYMFWAEMLAVVKSVFVIFFVGSGWVSSVV